MATERLAPNTLLDQTGLAGSLGDIDDDPDGPDGSWLTTGSNTSTACRTGFPTPSGNPTVGPSLQEFRVLVRKTNHPTDPTCSLKVFENGSELLQLILDQTISSTSGVVLSGTFNASSLGTADGSLVELQIEGTPGSGNPGNRASVEVGAVEWNAEVTVAAAGGTGDATLALGALGAAQEGSYVDPPAQGGDGDAVLGLAALGSSGEGSYDPFDPSGEATVGLGALALASEGSYDPFDPSGDVVAALAALGLSATGTTGDPPQGGNGAATLGLAAISVVGQASYDPFDPSASVTAALAALELSGAGDYTGPAEATATAELPALGFAAAGDHVSPAASDLVAALVALGFAGTGTHDTSPPPVAYHKCKRSGGVKGKGTFM